MAERRRDSSSGADVVNSGSVVGAEYLPGADPAWWGMGLPALERIIIKQ